MSNAERSVKCRFNKTFLHDFHRRATDEEWNDYRAGRAACIAGEGDYRAYHREWFARRAAEDGRAQ